MVDTNGKPDLTFIRKLRDAIKRAGFAEVFVDTDKATGIGFGDDFENRIYQAITDCDLLVAVVGANWVEILAEKGKTGDDDSVVMENSHGNPEGQGNRAGAGR